MRNFFSIILLISLLSQNLISDSFIYNSFNNHGVIGLINMPSARFYDEASHGITLYNGTPDQKITMTSFPYDWMEASFFILIFKVNHTVVIVLIPFASRIIRIKDLILNLELKRKDYGQLLQLVLMT